MKTIKPLKPEGGTTDESLYNAKVLFERNGQPDELLLDSDPKKGDWFVTAFWRDASGVETAKPFRFTGFAWGYGGTGPHGFDVLMEMVGAIDSRDGRLLTNADAPITRGKTYASIFPGRMHEEFKKLHPGAPLPWEMHAEDFGRSIVVHNVPSWVDPYDALDFCENVESEGLRSYRFDDVSDKAALLKKLGVKA